MRQYSGHSEIYRGPERAIEGRRRGTQGKREGDGRGGGVRGRLMVAWALKELTMFSHGTGRDGETQSAGAVGGGGEREGAEGGRETQRQRGV